MTTTNNAPQPIGFIGCGRMGQAIALGLLREQPDQPLVIFDPNDLAREAFLTAAQALEPHAHVSWCDTLQSLLASPLRALILAVKPQNVADVARDIAALDRGDTSTLLISIAAGLETPTLKTLFGPRFRILRAMPNTPALLAEGMTVLLKHAIHDDDLCCARELFSPLGALAEIDHEPLMHVVTALSGSGPAFAAVVVEALADGAVTEGLPRDLAYTLARHTLRGTMALLATMHPAQLKDAVGSPGGTTMAGLAAAETAGLRNALIQAVRAATQRGRELGQDPES